MNYLFAILLLIGGSHALASAHLAGFFIRGSCATDLEGQPNLSEQQNLAIQMIVNKASERLRTKLLELRRKHKFILPTDGIVDSDSAIEEIPPELLPSDPDVAATSHMINFLLQDVSSIIRMFGGIYSEVLKDRIRNGGDLPVMPLARRSPIGVNTLLRIIQRQGWESVFVVEEYLVDPNRFSRDVLSRLGENRIFYDSELSEVAHSSTVHMLQFLMVRPEVVTKFGEAAFAKFLKHIATPEGIKLWQYLFDSEVEHSWNFKWPNIFSGLQLVSDGYSYFGVD